MRASGRIWSAQRVRLEKIWTRRAPRVPLDGTLMVPVECAIVTNRVPVLAGPSQAEFEGSYQSDSSTGYRRPPSAPMAIWHHHCRGGKRRPVVVRGFAVPAHGLVRRANTRRSPTSRVEAPSTSQLDTPLLVKGGGGPCFRPPPPHVVCTNKLWSTSGRPLCVSLKKFLPFCSSLIACIVLP